MAPNRGRRIAAVVGWLCLAATMLGLIVLFNFFPGRVGVWASFGDSTSFVPLLAPGFERHMPGLNLVWALTFVLCLARARYGRSGAWIPLLKLVVDVLGLIVMFRLFFGGPVAGVRPEWLAARSDGATSVESVERLAQALNILAKGVLVVLIVVTIVSAISWIGRKFDEATGAPSSS